MLALQHMRKCRKITFEPEDACVVIRDSDGKIRHKQCVNLVATGAISGTWLGTLIGEPGHLGGM